MGSEMEQGEGHEGCYDDFIMIFGRYESYGVLCIVINTRLYLVDLWFC